MIRTRIKESFRNSKGCLGEIAWFDVVIRGSSSIFFDLVVGLLEVMHSSHGTQEGNSCYDWLEDYSWK